MSDCIFCKIAAKQIPAGVVYEDENMFPYIVEVWRCENGAIIFDTLGSRVPFISFEDQAGCAEPSRGRVYIQEKHGYAGPAEIPWPTP